MIKDLILRNRSYRRFYEDERMMPEQLKEFIDLARLSPSAANLQLLKYILIHTRENCEKAFDTLSWAGYLKDWDGPGKGERPAAYIIMLHDTVISDNYFCDHGIAAQSILLGAVEQGFGGCIVASVDRKKLRKLFLIPDNYRILQVIALGKPKETVQIERMTEVGDIRYWRDENQVHHVPKRNLDDLILLSE